jgi:hypothetical protein
MNENIMAWIDEYNSRPSPSLADELIKMLKIERGGDEEMDLETKEAQITAAHHAAEEAFWDELDRFFPGVSRAGVTGELAVRWNDMIRLVITTALERRGAK